MIADACQRSGGRYTEPWIRRYAEKGIWQIWIAVDDSGIRAVAGTEIVQYDTGLKEIGFRFCVGSGRRSWQHLAEDILTWAKSQGCSVGAGPFRKGWKAILQGWLHTHDFLERVL